MLTTDNQKKIFVQTSLLMPTEEFLAPILVVVLLISLGVFAYSYGYVGPGKLSPTPFHAAQRTMVPKA